MTPSIFIYYTPDWQPLADIVLPRVRKYCDRHNYSMEIFCKPARNDRPVGFWKTLELYCLLLRCEADAIFWVLDLDTLITNINARFDDYADDTHDIFITEDIHGINAGSWIVRNTVASRQFLSEVIDNFDAPEEQTVMKRFISNVDVCILEHPSINSYLYGLYPEEVDRQMTREEGQWHDGDLLLHLPGVTMDKRIEILKKMV